MKVINLDKFKKVQQVQLDGANYEVYGLTVDDYLNKGVIDKIEKAKTPENKVGAMLEALQKFTNIPKATLVKQEFPVLKALIMVIQGIDPSGTEGEKEEAGTAKK